MAGLPFVVGTFACLSVYSYLTKSTSTVAGVGGEAHSDVDDYYNDQLSMNPLRMLKESNETCPTQMCGEHCMADHEMGQSGLWLSTAICLYCLFGLAIICDEFFVASLEKISEGLQLSEDVAGATFMAAGSSAPELFVSMADNVFSKPQSVGVGTIIGSAIFNILIIIALTAALSGQTLLLDWRPLLRDSMWYCTSILILVFSVSDEYIQWYESLGMLVGYVLYIVYMGFNSKIVDACCKKKKNIPDLTESEAEKLKKALEDGEGGVELSDVNVEDKKEEEIPLKDDGDKKKEEGENEEGYFDALKPPSRVNDDGEESSTFMFVGSMFWFVITWPLMLVMKLTVPDCRFKIFDNNFGVIMCFTMSIVWIAILSHFLVEYATIFGCLVGISAPIMGLTLIAAGTSVPDAMSSVIVARQGEGDMAVSNAIGSNVFDILMGLGLPYLLASTVAHPGLTDPSGTPAIYVKTGDLAVSIAILFGVVVAVVAMLLLTKWKLYSWTGYILVVLYAAFVIFSIATGLGQ